MLYKGSWSGSLQLQLRTEVGSFLFLQGLHWGVIWHLSKDFWPLIACKFNVVVYGKLSSYV